MAGPVDNYAVMGNPIDHSKSPVIHTLFANQTGQSLRYTAILVDIDGLQKAIDAFFENGDLGLSITVPFKEEAWQLAEKRTSRAEKAGAVNTLWQDEHGQLRGDNTDGLGLVADLKENNGITIKGARVLILGAGGAVRGVLEPILSEQPVDVVIANRTRSKADTLVDLFPDETLSASGFEDIEGRFDLIINGTAASLQGEMPPIPGHVIDQKTCCYDMMYGAEETVFNRWCREQGAGKTIDGLGMLVEQAAEQFAIWRGVRPETREVLGLLRNEIA
ncbi:shikimate dehydrogenase [Endozoicomonas sp. SCSIO W0465]|uniref:shikimate dehydrogenase n=1 Tax=Endozoicomonas sp. SCSIO W0465 TaxID=2918516 RepID=UPI002074CE9B|nr:shikimate dehydrogenase [Endozoicomonas sp. SCSIO W0465]USE36695.1 shikimate dehydrogenase [Endozoicomonas sp. SCSIO W0465]